jgi:hypothetical protein
MVTPVHVNRVPPAVRQYGQAFLLSLLILIVGMTAIVYNFSTRASAEIGKGKITAAALAQAKEALIGYAAAHSTQPGILPCPDTDNDGSADSPCGAMGVTALGRLPWKTLGLPDLRDGDGECLWYAVSSNFKNSGMSGPAKVNADSAGTLRVNDTSGTAVYSGSNAVLAVVLAPGRTLDGQDRAPAGTTQCGGNTTAASYLEGGNQNGAATNTFVSGPATSTFNDISLVLTSDALFNVVNIRVAKEAITALESYRGTNSYYPFANAYGTASPYNCNAGLNRGRFPITLGGCGQPVWGAALPAWFSTNDWNLVTHYATSKACGQVGLGSVFIPLVGVVNLDNILIFSCTTLGTLTGLNPVLVTTLNTGLALLGLSFIDDPVTVTGVSSNVRVLVVVTGRAQAAQAHPCISVGQCMEDAANTDGNATYAKPSRYPTSNDRMAMTCASNVPCGVLP